MPCVSDAIDKLAKQYERNPCSLVSFLNPFLNVAGLGQLQEHLTAEREVTGSISRAGPILKVLTN